MDILKIQPKDIIPFIGVGRYMSRTREFRISSTHALNTIEASKPSTADTIVDNQLDQIDITALLPDNMRTLDTSVEDQIHELEQLDRNFKSTLRSELRADLRMHALIGLNAGYMILGATSYFATKYYGPQILQSIQNMIR